MVVNSGRRRFGRSDDSPALGFTKRADRHVLAATIHRDIVGQLRRMHFVFEDIESGLRERSGPARPRAERGSGRGTKAGSKRPPPGQNEFFCDRREATEAPRKPHTIPVRHFTAFYLPSNVGRGNSGDAVCCSRRSSASFATSSGFFSATLVVSARSSRRLQRSRARLSFRADFGPGLRF